MSNKTNKAGERLAQKTVDQLRNEAIIALDSRVVRLEDELEKMLKLIVFTREAIQNECMDGLGYKQLTQDLKVVNKIKELSLAFVRVTEAQIKLNKSRKDIAEQMTPEDEKKAVRDYIRSLPDQDRMNFLDSEITVFNDQRNRNMRTATTRTGAADAV